MPYSEFDLRTARERLGLTLRVDVELFAPPPEAEVPESLRASLDRWVPIALATGSEKARSEMIIAPILMEAVSRTGHALGLFSGATFDVDRDRGLSGVCDYLLTRSAERYFIDRPVVAVVEAKREDITAGLGQCAAAMVGARLFNERGGAPAAPVHGAVTSGTNWRFLRLDGDLVTIDSREYQLPELAYILGILSALTA